MLEQLKNKLNEPHIRAKMLFAKDVAKQVAVNVAIAGATIIVVEGTKAVIKAVRERNTTEESAE